MIKFIIPVKYSATSNSIINLVHDLSIHHPNDEVVVVDSDSADKSYFDAIQHPNLNILDIANQHWMCGAWWSGIKSTPQRDHYALLHDSMKFKANIDHLLSDLLFLMYFERKVSPTFAYWSEKLCAENERAYNVDGFGCWGPMLFASNKTISDFQILGVDKYLPSNKAETGYCEGLYGAAAELLGFDIPTISLYGDVLFEESRRGRSGVYPHQTAWMHPIEKFYASHHDTQRL